MAYRMAHISWIRNVETVRKFNLFHNRGCFRWPIISPVRKIKWRVRIVQLHNKVLEAIGAQSLFFALLNSPANALYSERIAKLNWPHKFRIYLFVPEKIKRPTASKWARFLDIDDHYSIWILMWCWVLSLAGWLHSMLMLAPIDSWIEGLG